MCISNDEQLLQELRSRKRAIVAWKRVQTTHGFPISDWDQRTRWVPETTVVADRIRKPLKNKAVASSGLYFYLGKSPCTMGEDCNCFIDSIHVSVRINPKDVIAANERVIVATKAFVTKSIIVDRPRRISYLSRRIGDAKANIQRLKNRIEELSDKEEALRRMQEELKQLKALE